GSYEALLFHIADRRFERGQGLAEDLVGVASSDERPPTVEVDAVQDERLTERAALIGVLRVQPTPVDVLDRLIRAAARRGAGAEEDLPVAVVAVDLPGDALARQDLVHPVAQLGRL